MTSVRSEALPKTGGRRAARATTGHRPADPDFGRGFTPPAPLRAVPPLPRNLVGLSIVVVDDDDGSLDYFAVALRACGATVRTAATATDALALVRERHPNVVLSDIAMSGHDGYWLVREIRALEDEAMSRVPIVAATAFGREHSRQRALEAGFSEHLRKPVDPDVLCRTIGKMAGR